MGAFFGIAVVWLIIEMLLWYVIAQFVSGWWVFAWFIVAGVIGLNLLKKGMTNLRPMASQMRGGMANPASRPPESVMTTSFAKAVAGLLLLIPGVLSDVLAVLLLLPPVQTKLKTMVNAYVLKNQEKVMAMMQAQMKNSNIDPSQFGGMGGFGSFGKMGGMTGQGGFGQTFEGEATVVKPTQTQQSNTKVTTKITHAANDED